MKTITKQWLDIAESDLKCCENNLNDEFVTNIVAFHSQQAVEKVFKAIIEEKELKFEKTHNLFKLFSLISETIDIEIDIDKIEILDRIYISSRYPSELGILPDGKPTINEATEIYEFAKKIFTDLKNLIQNIK